MCHLNYEEESLAQLHACANVGCETCHGRSMAHASDEDNITPPDVLFAREDSRGACQPCHERLRDGHAPVPPSADAGMKGCTDCHGEHRLNHRTRRWDRKTRKLLEDDKVRMLTGQGSGPP